jgi:hypothetical protein
MDFITNIIADLVSDGIISDTALLFIILGLLWWAYKNSILPLKKRIDEIPTYSEVKSYADDLDDGHIDSLKEVSMKLDKIVEELDSIEELGKENRRDIQDLKRDIEHTKQILNQFQGHLMYNNRGDFGNRELR